MFVKLGNKFVLLKELLQIILTSFHVSLLYIFPHVSFHHDNLL